jgi:dihydrofolate reductase
MIISAIVAVSNNLAIGVDNDLPWHMPADLKFFKDTTRGFHVLMGRKSFDSIKKPLPGRTNIVITRQQEFYHSGVITRHSIQEGIQYALDANVQELFVLGGANIYEQTQDLWDQLYLTKIDTEIPHGTAYFPAIDYRSWIIESEEKHLADENNPHDYTFLKYVRK